MHRFRHWRLLGGHSGQILSIRNKEEIKRISPRRQGGGERREGLVCVAGGGLVDVYFDSNEVDELNELWEGEAPWDFAANLQTHEVDKRRGWKGGT
jgi:hypothetical protein